jgi:hypothetical protein
MGTLEGSFTAVAGTVLICTVFITIMALRKRRQKEQPGAVTGGTGQGLVGNLPQPEPVVPADPEPAPPIQDSMQDVRELLKQNPILQESEPYGETEGSPVKKVRVRRTNAAVAAEKLQKTKKLLEQSKRMAVKQKSNRPATDVKRRGYPRVEVFENRENPPTVSGSHGGRGRSVAKIKNLTEVEPPSIEEVIE